MVRNISGVDIMEVGGIVHALRTQIHMEGYVVRTMTVPNMMAESIGVREMK